MQLLSPSVTDSYVTGAGDFFCRRRYIFLASFVWGVCFCGISFNSSAQDWIGLSVNGLAEEESRFLPGNYFFHKGSEALTHGDAREAAQLWRVAAFWGQKTAQYDLGILYFKGKSGVDKNRPLGLAWLALANERDDSMFQESLAAAWEQSSQIEHEKANQLWRELKKTYADSVALIRAKRRYENEVHNITGSRVGGTGPVIVITRSDVTDSALYVKRIQREADFYFGTSKAHVEIGPFITLHPKVNNP